jgi:hypothetical protein
MRAWIVAIVVALALRADADPAEDAALLHLDRGVAAFDAKDFATALKEFTAANELVPDKANPYRWLALTEIQLGDCASALPHIQTFLAKVPPTDARVAEMTRWRAFCRREPAQPEPPTSPQVTGTQNLAPAPPPPEDMPVTMRWWFWPVVGGAVVAAAGATIYFATRGEEMTTLPTIRCDATGCR